MLINVPAVKDRQAQNTDPGLLILQNHQDNESTCRSGNTNAYWSNAKMAVL